MLSLGLFTAEAEAVAWLQGFLRRRDEARRRRVTLSSLPCA